MDDAEIVELQARSVTYYSPGDEEAFFEWLDRIECVEGGSGSGDTLYISVNRAEVDEDCLTELLALFRRYEVDLKQLRVFDSEEFAPWFRNPKAYWYAEVFG